MKKLEVMKEEIESYFGRLASLYTLELERSAQRVVNTEKRHVAQVIAHIAEISKRKAHIELGYRTLFDYCVRYCESRKANGRGL